MDLSNKYSGLLRGILYCWVNIILIMFGTSLWSQNYFPLGIYSYDTPQPVSFNPAEGQLINDMNASYITGLEKISQDSIILFCQQQGNKKVGLEHDPTYVPGAGPYYPLAAGGEYPPDPTNTILWAYISRNKFITDIDSMKIEQFIRNVDLVYNHPYNQGLGEIRIAHQGYMDSSSHWPAIKYAYRRIQHYFGDDVKSSVIHNVFHWSRSSLVDFFGYLDSLDVYQHEEYPFLMHNQPDPNHITQCAPFSGWQFQDWYIDTLILGSYEQTRNALQRSGNSHTKLEVIIQTHRCWVAEENGTFFRRPTEAEIWLQAFLALSRGYKGVHSYVYRSYSPYNQWGLVDQSSPRQPIYDTTRYNHDPYHVVARLYDHLSDLGPKVLPLVYNKAFTWTGTPYKYIKNITGDSTEENHKTIEVSVFRPYNNYEHFMLINRRCNRDSSGIWVNAYPQYINLTLADSLVTGIYQIRDVYSDELYITGNKTFSNIKLLAGRGRVFELRKVFDQDENWIGAVNISGTITVPGGKTLTVQPGTSVKFSVGARLDVNGKLIAPGSSSARITFTSAKATPARGDWNGIRLLSGSAGSVVTYCDIFYATKGIYTTVSASIQNNNIRHFSEQGVYLSGKNSTADIQYNTITNGGIQGIYVTGSYSSGTPTIQYNQIGISGDALTYGFERYNATGNVVYFKNNTVQYTSGSGAAINVSYASLGVVNNTITLNAGHGIWVKTQGKPDIHDNDINYNGKTGIYVEKSSPTNIKWNNIQGNGSHGISFLSTCATTYYNSVMKNTWNNIYNNSGYELNNLKSTKLIAENQFWNSTNYNQIDLEVNGNVDFDPWKATANPDAGPGGGIGKIISQEQVLSEETALPEDFQLRPNFPNPFNPETLIQYDLPHEAYVTIKVFNLLGKEITTLFEGQKAAGYHNVVWNGKNHLNQTVPSGVYLYSIKALSARSNYIATRKMLLIK